MEVVSVEVDTEVDEVLNTSKLGLRLSKLGLRLSKLGLRLVGHSEVGPRLLGQGLGLLGSGVGLDSVEVDVDCAELVVVAIDVEASVV